jgi:hypothetical protein
MEGVAKLQAVIGYQFRNPELLTRALTHKSRAFETNSQQPERLPDNEQLDFWAMPFSGSSSARCWWPVRRSSRASSRNSRRTW